MSFRLPADASPREAVAGLLVLLAIAAAVYVQLFDNAGFYEPTATRGPTVLVATAGLAFLFAFLLAPRTALRSPLALPVLALALLTALTFIVPSWAETLPDQVTRLGLLTLAYTLLAASGLVLASRFGALPVLLLVAVTATVAGAMGLWGFATIDEELAGLNQGDFVPVGPLAYRNTLALLCVSALIPLGRWAIPAVRDATSVGISIASGLALGISAIVVAVSLSEFALAFSGLLVLAVLVWPGPSVGVPVRKALAPLLAAGLVAFAAWVVYRKLLPLPPEPDGIRLTLALCLVAVTPALVWGISLATERLSEGSARRAGYGLVGLGALALLVVAIGPGLPTGSAELRGRYYEVVIDALYDEPLAGVGPGNYFQSTYSSQLFLLGSNNKFAHTIPGEMWVELGLAGLLATLLLYAGAVRDAWRTRRVPNAALLAPFVLGFLLSGLIDWSWHIPAMTALWAAALGAVAGANPSRPDPGPGAESGAGPPRGLSSSG